MLLALAMAAATTMSGEPFVLPLMEACSDTTTAPACRVSGGVDRATAQARLADGETQAWWVEDNVFHVVARRTAPSVALCCAVQSAMEKVGDTSDLWSLSTRIEGVRSAVLDVMIFGEADETAPPVSRSAQWRGPEAPARAEVAEIPDGLLSKQDIESIALNERRVVEIYRPAGDGPMPVIYLADGESASMFAETIHPLILRGELPPIMIVGLYSGPIDPPEGADISLIRHQEYLPGWGGEPQPRYIGHDRFLTEEVMPLAESLGASSRREDRAVAGYSNGAAWAMAMATDHPDLFGKVMALSFGWRDDAFFERIRQARYGDVWIGAGTLEPAFHDLSAQTATVLSQLADRVTFDSRVAGHSPVMWHDQFPVATRWLFAP